MTKESTILHAGVEARIVLEKTNGSVDVALLD